MINIFDILGAKIKKLVKKLFDFWNSILGSVKRIIDTFRTKFGENCKGVSIWLKRDLGVVKRVTTLFTETNEGYSSKNINSDVNIDDLPDEYRFLGEGQKINLDRDFEDVLVLEN